MDILKPWRELKRWWNGAPIEEPPPKPVPVALSRAVIRKYQQFRVAFVAGDQEGIERASAILEKSGYPVPTTLAEADLYIAKYGNRHPT